MSTFRESSRRIGQPFERSCHVLRRHRLIVPTVAVLDKGTKQSLPHEAPWALPALDVLSQNITGTLNPTIKYG